MKRILTTGPLLTPNLYDPRKRYEEDETYELLGVIVNQKEMSDDPSHHNRLAWVLIDLINVMVHTFFIWIISLPLAIAVIGYQVRV